MTIDTRTEAERRYDALKDGSTYVKPTADDWPAEVASGAISPLRYAARWLDQHCAAPTPIDPVDALRAQFDASQDYATRLQLIKQIGDIQDARRKALEAERDDVLIGHIDGAPVLAHYICDINNPDDDGLAWAKVVWQGIEIEADGCSYLNLPMTGGCVGDIQLAEWLIVKQLAQTDVCERLMAVARRYPRFRDVPPVLPPVAPQVRVTHNWYDVEQNNDICDEPRGPLAYTNFLCGSKDADNSCEISFPVNKRERPVVYMFGRDELGLDEVERTLDSLLALLADPRVQAAREAH